MRACHLQAAAALRDVGDTRGEAFALLQEVGSAYLHKNEVDSALRVASAALRQLRTCEDLSGEVTALKATAEIHLTRGDTEPALRLLQEVVSLCRDSGDVEDQVDALIRIARLWVLRSEPEEATKAAKAALEAAQSGKKELAEAEALLGLAGVLKAKKDLAGAQTEAGKAEKLFKKCGHRTGELAALMLSWSAMVEEGPQQVAQVVQAAKKAAEAFKSAGDQQCAAEAFLEASAASREHGQVEEAASTAAAALQLFRQLGHTSGEVK
ncbi:TTC28, partial [Symbiodinium microadriaticum]